MTRKSRPYLILRSTSGCGPRRCSSRRVRTRSARSRPPCPTPRSTPWPAAISSGRLRRPAAGGTPGATGPIVAALGSPVADLRAQAARALGLRAETSALAPLIAAAKDADPTVRLQAIIGLGRIKDAKAVPALGPVLTDSDAYLAFAARVALRRIGAWKAVAPPTEPKGRAALLAALEQQYATDAVAALKAAATDRTRPADERAKALGYLSQAHHKPVAWDGHWWGTRPTQGKPPAKSVAWEGTPLVLAAVRDALADPDVPVRLAAVSAVREEDDREALPRLRERFGVETDEAVRREIASAFGAMDDKAALPLLIAAIRHATAPESVREASLASVETIGTDAAIGALVDLLREAGLKPGAAARLVAAAGRFKARAAVPTIVAMLAHADPKVRAAAAEALGKIGDTDATPRVRPLLKDESLDVRKAAIAAVAALKDRESIPALILAAESEPTQYEATVALAAMPDIRALHVHLRGLSHRSQDVRKASVTALSAIRDEARPALERLAGRKETADLGPARASQDLRRDPPRHRVEGRRPVQVRRAPAVLRPAPGRHVEAGHVRGQAPGVEDGEGEAKGTEGEVDVNTLYASNDHKSVFAVAEVEGPEARPAPGGRRLRQLAPRLAQRPRGLQARRRPRLHRGRE